MAIYPVLQTGLLNQSSAQVIDGSLKFVPGSSTHLKKTFPSSGNGRTWTWSCWTKRGNLGSGILIDCSSGSDRFRIRYISDKFDMASDTTIYRQTNALLRDPSAWYHLVAVLDTTLDNANANDRVRLYINGVRVTSFNTSNNPSQNNSFILNTNILHQIGELCDGGSNYDGEMSQVYFIDGAALEPENFGFTDPLTNTWRPKKYKHRTDLYGVTWSSALVGDASGFQSAALAADGFDGEVGSSNNQYAQNNTGSNPSTITFTPVGGIKFNSSIQVYLINADNTVNVNGEGAQTIAANQWVTVKTGSGTLNTLVFSRASNGGASFSAIRVDGHILIDAQNDNSFYLPMDGNSPIGNDKSNPNPLNGGTTWSSSASVDSGSSDMTLAFDGDISTATSVGLPSGGATVTFTPPSAITVSIGLRVYMAVDRGQSISVNGSQTNSSVSAGWNDTGFTGSLTSLVVGPANGGSSNNIAAIEVDGVLLVDDQIGDNNWTPVNFGGSVALDNPKVSGARPILNTTPGGTNAAVGVFGSKEGFFETVSSSSGSGNPYIFDGRGTRPTLSMIRGATYSFDYTAATSHPLFLSSLDDGKHNSKAYSVQFDGSDDYLTLAQTDDFDLTGDYTYEAFIYCTDTSGNPTIFDFSAVAGNYEGRLQIQAGVLKIYDGGWQSRGAISANIWHHVAVTQSRIYVDGVDVGASSGSVSGSNYKKLTIGARTNDGGSSYGDYFTGYISNVRIVNGTAVYTSGFNPPQTSLEAITNTKLLCCQHSVATNALVTPGTITANGGASATNSYNPFLYNVNNYYGVNTSTSNVTKITIPHYTADTLYYYCANHSGMGNSISVTTDETKADPYAWKCTLALPLVGNDKDVSHLVNSTSTEKAVANTGVEFLSESSNFYGGSAKIFGTDKLNVTESNSDFTFGTSTDFTIECWTLITSSHHYGRIIEIGTVNNNAFLVDGDGPDGDTSFRLRYDYNNVSFYGTYNIVLDKWHHVAAVRKSGTLTLYVDGVACGSVDISTSDLPGGNAQIGNYLGSNLDYDGYIQDLRVYKGVAKYTSNFVPAATSPDILPDTPSGVSGSSELTKITDGSVSFDGTSDSLTFTSTSDVSLDGDFTIEFWAYPNTIVNDTSDPSPITMPTDGSAISQIYIHSSNFNYNLHKSSAIVSTVNNTAVTNRWQHVAFTRSGTTVYAFFNGVLQDTATSSATFGGTSGTFRLGSFSEDNGNYDGYMSNVRIVKGTALYTSNFTPPTRALTNVTNTKLLCCQSNTSAIEGAVKPGAITAVGDAAATNFNPFNTDINTVRGQESGYATLNPLDKLSNVTLSNGNLTCTSGSNIEGVRSTIPFPRTGMWYVEYHMDTVSTGGYPVTGIANASKSLSAYAGAGTASVRPVSSGRNLGWVIDSSDTPSNYMWTGFALSAGGDTMQIAFNADKGAYYMGVNNSWWGLSGSNAIRVSTTDMLNGTNSAYDVSGDDYFAWAVPYEEKCTLNYGQKPFKFAPPDGFQPLNLANTRPETVIARPDQYVGVTTYTGNGSSQDILTGFQPDLVWHKARDANNAYQIWSDSVRGTAKILRSDSVNAQQDYGSYGVTNYLFNGYVVTDNAPGDYNTNGSAGGTYAGSSGGYVSCAWKAGGNKNTFNIDDVGYASAAAAGLTAGDTTLTGASVGTKQGFSIIKYTGPNDTNNHEVPHGLSQAPDFIIAKNLDATYNWDIYHSSLADDAYLIFTGSSTRAQGFSGRPTSTVFKTEHDYSTNENQEYIAYCWHDVPGLQKFGTYSGNSSTDGPFIELGFRPALFVMKQIDAGGYWMVYDSARDPINDGSPNYLFWNDDAQEGSGYDLDFLSNGVKLRTDNANFNTTSYIYMAWAEAPTVNLYGGQSNAR